MTNVRARRPLAERFWNRVDRGAPDACWPFLGYRERRGYGRLGVDGKVVEAHRVAFFLTNGRWPLLTRHKCDNPPCCNPAHLIDGDHAANMRDMVASGHSLRGARNHRAKLTPDDVMHIRTLIGLSSTKELAIAFGVHQAHIRAIVSGRKWR